jgi:uncharacterized protein YegL
MRIFLALLFTLSAAQNLFEAAECPSGSKSAALPSGTLCCPAACAVCGGPPDQGCDPLFDTDDEPAEGTPACCAADAFVGGSPRFCSESEDGGGVEAVCLIPPSLVELDAVGAGCEDVSDIVLLVDGSGSLGEAGAASVKDFVVDVASALRVGRSGVAVGIVQFGAEVERVTPTLIADAAQLRVHALSLEWMRGGYTNIERGLAEATSMLEGGRPTAKKRIILLTDGQPNRCWDAAKTDTSDASGVGCSSGDVWAVAEASLEARAEVVKATPIQGHAVELYTIAVQPPEGERPPNIESLRRVASEPKDVHAISASSFDSLRFLIPMLQTRACPAELPYVCQSPFEVLVIQDFSGSVVRHQAKVIEFISGVADSMPWVAGGGSDGSRLAMVAFDVPAYALTTPRASGGDYFWDDRDDFFSMINGDLPPSGGRTAWGFALRAATYMVDQSTLRDGVPRLVIYFTDSLSNTKYCLAEPCTGPTEEDPYGVCLRDPYVEAADKGDKTRKPDFYDWAREEARKRDKADPQLEFCSDIGEHGAALRASLEAGGNTAYFMPIGLNLETSEKTKLSNWGMSDYLIEVNAGWGNILSAVNDFRASLPCESECAVSDHTYVDGTAGSDSNDGKSWATAVRTLAKALTVHTAGCMVKVKPGATYSSASLSLAVTRAVLVCEVGTATNDKCALSGSPVSLSDGAKLELYDFAVDSVTFDVDSASLSLYNSQLTDSPVTARYTSAPVSLKFISTGSASTTGDGTAVFFDASPSASVSGGTGSVVARGFTATGWSTGLRVLGVRADTDLSREITRVTGSTSIILEDVSFLGCGRGFIGDAIAGTLSIDSYYYDAVSRAPGSTAEGIVGLGVIAGRPSLRLEAQRVDISLPPVVKATSTLQYPVTVGNAGIRVARIASRYYENDASASPALSAKLSFVQISCSPSGAGLHGLLAKDSGVFDFNEVTVTNCGVVDVTHGGAIASWGNEYGGDAFDADFRGAHISGSRGPAVSVHLRGVHALRRSTVTPSPSSSLPLFSCASGGRLLLDPATEENLERESLSFSTSCVGSVSSDGLRSGVEREEGGGDEIAGLPVAIFAGIVGGAAALCSSCAAVFVFICFVGTRSKRGRGRERERGGGSIGEPMSLRTGGYPNQGRPAAF